MVRHRDIDNQGRFIHYANTTIENIFGTSKPPSTNPSHRYSRSTSYRGEIEKN